MKSYSSKPSLNSKEIIINSQKSILKKDELYRNLQTRKLLACLNKSILQKSFHNEQEILTQFKSQMLDRMHSNDVALKEIYTKFFTLVSNIKDHAGCRSQNFHNIKNSLQLFCTKQQCEGEKKLEDESYLQGFKGKTRSFKVDQTLSNCYVHLFVLIF